VHHDAAPSAIKGSLRGLVFGIKVELLQQCFHLGTTQALGNAQQPVVGLSQVLG
jgi:hypothetical protein